MGFAIIIYGIFLVVFDSFATPTMEADPSIAPEILPPIGLSVAFLVIVVQFRFILPQIKSGATGAEVFPIMLISSMLNELIGAFGLLIGILDIFVFYQEVRWDIVFSFLFTGFLLQLYFIRTLHKPKFENTLQESGSRNYE